MHKKLSILNKYLRIYFNWVFRLMHLSFYLLSLSTQSFVIHLINLTIRMWENTIFGVSLIHFSLLLIQQILVLDWNSFINNIIWLYKGFGSAQNPCFFFSIFNVWRVNFMDNFSLFRVIYLFIHLNCCCCVEVVNIAILPCRTMYEPCCPPR